MTVVDRNGYPFAPLEWKELPPEEMQRRARAFFEEMNARRSVRELSDRAVPRELIEWAIRTASTAPSGAHRQPWRFVAVSDPEIKREIRAAAEREEKKSYEGGRMPEEWRRALAPLGTSWEKPQLEIAPWLVVLFEETHGVDADGGRRKNYYTKESVGICAGLFIVAIHHMGLVTHVHTPSPMRFLSQILGRPENERPFLLFPIGYPAKDALVPVLRRKPLEDVAIWHPRKEP